MGREGETADGVGGARGDFLVLIAAGFCGGRGVDLAGRGCGARAKVLGVDADEKNAILLDEGENHVL